MPADLRDLGTANPDEPSLIRRWIAPYFLVFDRVLVEDADGGLRIAWTSPSIVWIAVLVFTIYIERLLARAALGPPAAAHLAGLAAWTAATYVVLSKVTNRSVIRAARGSLSLRFGPLPYPGGFDVPAPDVAGVQWSVLGTNGCGTFASYAVYAVVRGKRRLLLSNIPHGHAQVLAHAVEACLRPAP